MSAAIASAVLCVSTALVVAVPSLRAAFVRSPSRPSYQVGEHVDVSATLYSSSARTLLVFARHDCAACQRSKPALTATLTSLKTLDVAVFLMVPDAIEDEMPFAREVGIEPSAVKTMKLDQLRLRYVPTFVLVDQTGKILVAREGVLTTEGQGAILQAATVADSR